MLRPAAIVDGAVTSMSNVSSPISGATDNLALVHESDVPPTRSVPRLLAGQPELELTSCFTWGGSVVANEDIRPSLQTRWRLAGSAL
jgi:hypothetical protein